MNELSTTANQPDDLRTQGARVHPVVESNGNATSHGVIDPPRPTDAEFIKLTKPRKTLELMEQQIKQIAVMMEEINRLQEEKNSSFSTSNKQTLKIKVKAFQLRYSHFVAATEELLRYVSTLTEDTSRIQGFLSTLLKNRAHELEGRFHECKYYFDLMYGNEYEWR